MTAAFAARIEDVLAVYERPYHLLFSVVCFEEQPCVRQGQPIELLPPLPAQPVKAGRPRRESSTCVRQGTACLLVALELGTG